MAARSINRRPVGHRANTPGSRRRQCSEIAVARLKRPKYFARPFTRASASAARWPALLSNLWEEAKDHAEIDRKGKINPTLDTKVRYKVKRSTKAWSAEAHEAFLATARSTLTLAADLRPAGRGCHQGALV